MNRALLPLLFLTACGGPIHPPDQAGRASASAAAALSPCEVTEAARVTQVAATRDGAVFVFDTDDGQVAQRFTGTGCALRSDGSARVAIDALLGADDLGQLYVFPRETRDRATVTTLFPGGRREGYVARVDPAGHVTKLLDAGRGIWGFGVSPEGGSLWYEGCVPGGVHAIRDGAVDPTDAMPAPQTLWNQYESVLTDDHTFWSIGYRTCERGAPMTAECGHPLVRSTAEGSRDVGPAVFDLGEGFEIARLSSCGARLCGLVAAANAVVIWNADGVRTHTLRRTDVGAQADEAIVSVSGNARGVYLLLHGPRGARVVFTDAP